MATSEEVWRGLAMFFGICLAAAERSGCATSIILAGDCRFLLDREEVQRGREHSNAQSTTLDYLLASSQFEVYNIAGQSSSFCLPPKREHNPAIRSRIFFGLPLKGFWCSAPVGLFSSCDGFAHKSKSLLRTIALSAYSGAAVGYSIQRREAN